MKLVGNDVIALLLHASRKRAVLCRHSVPRVQELHKRYWVGGVEIVARQQAHSHAATKAS
jgi:hypothetical protein